MNRSNYIAIFAVGAIVIVSAGTFAGITRDLILTYVGMLGIGLVMIYAKFSTEPEKEEKKEELVLPWVKRRQAVKAPPPVQELDQNDPRFLAEMERLLHFPKAAPAPAIQVPLPRTEIPEIKVRFNMPKEVTLTELLTKYADGETFENVEVVGLPVPRPQPQPVVVTPEPKNGEAKKEETVELELEPSSLEG